MLLSRRFLIICINFILSIKYRAILASPISNESENKDVCSSATCIKEASFFQSIINQNVDPCDDFHQFVCGNFANSTFLPDDSNEVEIFSLAVKNFNNDLINDLKSNIDPNEDQDGIQKLKMYYQNCINETIIESEGIKPYVELLEKLGGWPLLENNWKETDYTWENTLKKINSLGIPMSFPLSINIVDNIKNPSKFLIKMEPPLIPLTHNKTRNDFIDFVMDISVDFGANKDTARQEIEEMIDFEINCYKIRTNTPGPVVNYQLTVSDLSQKFTDVNWLNLLNEIYSPFNVHINESMIVEIQDIKYFLQFNKLLNNTPKKVIANYQIWHTLSKFIKLMPKKYTERFSHYYQSVTGKNDNGNRETRCLKEVKKYFPLALIGLNAKKYLTKEIKSDLRNMTSNALKIFKNALGSVDWMDESTRNYALKKFQRVRSAITETNDTEADKYYEDLKITSGVYAINKINTGIFTNAKIVQLLNNSNELYMSEFVEHRIAYFPSLNLIFIPEENLREPLYRIDRPKYLNYGAIGNLIDSKITSGFYYQGCKFGKTGKPEMWCTQKTMEMFRNKTRCLYNKYNDFLKKIGYSAPGHVILPVVGDINGLKSAYQAYKKLNITEPSLSGLNYTPQQMFWISAGSTWCRKTNEKFVDMILSTDLKTAVSDIKEFAEDFNCKTDAPMNPENKCDIW